jgi:putative tryptophan/tyrosine transport system substrate-binding protein
MKRRDFIALLGGATVAWPISARAQQAAIPAVGFLSARPANASDHLIKAFRAGLGEIGFIEGQNVQTTFRWADGHYERLPTLASELVQAQVAVIAAFGGAPPVRAAKAATRTIPIVFTTGDDPVQSGLVSSMNRPSGNVTGVTFFSGELGAKILNLLHSLIPNARSVAVISNSANPTGKAQSNDIQDSAKTFGIQIHAFNAELDKALDAAQQSKVDAIIVTADPFFISQREPIAAFAKQNAIPIVSAYRELTDAGTLMSYGASLTDAYRQVGVYVGRILKGEQPADLPILQPTKFELVINLRAAKALSLEVPPTLLALADDVIE